MSINPLLQYSIQPGIFVKLPSGGRFYENPPILTADKEIEVKPMNAVDEIQLQNPDGLFNNESIFKVVEHCVPSISNPREINKPDMEILLLALKIATYGETQDMSFICSKCEELNEFAVDLGKILAAAKSIPDEISLMIGELKINVRPHTVESEQKLLEKMVSVQRLANDLERQSEGNESDQELMLTLEKEMTAQVNESAAEVFKIASLSIVSVETPDATITERNFINEWLDSIKGPEYRKIRDLAKLLSDDTLNTEVKFPCNKCGEENRLEVDVSPANFFDNN